MLGTLTIKQLKQRTVMIELQIATQFYLYQVMNYYAHLSFYNIFGANCLDSKIASMHGCFL